MDFQSSPLPHHDIYLDPPPPPAPQWSQLQRRQDQGGGGGGGDHHHHDQEHGSVVARPDQGGSMVVRARLAKIPPPEAALKCPRCESTNTKFCYFNNYSLSQPRHFCKACRRYWTRGGALRNVPVGGGCRRRSSNNNNVSKNINKRKRESKSPITNSKPNYNISISGGIFENFLAQSTHPAPAHMPPILPPNLPGDQPLISDHHQYSLHADIYGPAAGGAGSSLGMGSGAVGFILGNRFHNISEQWIRGPPAVQQSHHDDHHQFPYMDPNPLASEIVDHDHPLMKVELGSVGVNLSRNLLGSSNIDHDHDHHQYWAAGGNDNVMMMSNIDIASSAWTTDHHVSRFVHMTNSSTPTTHDLLM